ncbi:lymphocyte function-associated antigen 3 [Glossophaga mutica]
MGKVKVSRGTAVKAVVYLAILLLQFDFSSCKSSAVLTVVGTVNGNVTLSPSNTGSFTEIMWKKGKNKVSELDSHGFRAYPPFVGRVHLDNTSGDLHISNLTSSDEGEYEVEILHSSTSKKFNLMVFDPLPSPNLRCNLVNESTEVSCDVPESYSRHREQLTYSWHCPLPQCEESTAPVLHFKNDNFPKRLQCSVANLESNRTSLEDLLTCAPPDKSRHRYLLTLTPLIVTSLCVLVIYCVKQSRRAGPASSS